MCKRFYLVLIITSSLFPCLIAQPIVWSKFPVNELNLYNMPGKTAPGTIVTSNKQGVLNYTYSWNRKVNSSTELVYESLIPFPPPPNVFTTSQFMENVFGMKFKSESTSQGQQPYYYFSSPKNDETIATFTIEARINNFNQWVYFPRIIFKRKSISTVKESVTAEKICKNNKTQIRVSGLLVDEIYPAKILLNSKDVTSRFNSSDGINLQTDDFSGPAKFTITDDLGIELGFSVPVQADGLYAACPSPVTKEIKPFLSLKQNSTGFEKAVLWEGTVSNVDESALQVQAREGVKATWKKTGTGINIQLYALAAELEQGVEFTDGQNTFRVSSAMLTAQQKTLINNYASVQQNKLLTLRADGDELIVKGDTAFTELKKHLFYEDDKAIQFAANNLLATEGIYYRGERLQNETLRFTKEFNGVPVTITLKDKLGYSKDVNIIVMMQDQPDPVTTRSLSADQLYKNYFDEGFVKGSNFLQTPPALSSYYLKNTTVNLKKPFLFSYKTLPSAVHLPSVIFKMKDKVDYFEIRFNKDSAWLLQKQEGLATDLHLDSIRLGIAGTQEITFERRNHYLLYGDKQRRDRLFINDIPFRNITLETLWEDTSSVIGFSFPSSSANYRFNNIALSEHTMMQEEITRIDYRDEELLSMYFTGEQGSGIISKNIFDQAGRKSFAVLIANNHFEPSPLSGLQQQDLPGADKVMDSLRQTLCKQYQFDSSHVKILYNVKSADLDILFQRLMNPTYFRNYFQLPSTEQLDLSEVQLLIGLVSHGTEEGKVVLADGLEKDMKRYLNPLIKKENGEPAFTYRSVLYVEDVCYGSFSVGQNNVQVTAMGSGNESLKVLYNKELFDAEPASCSFHAASYNLGQLSVDIKFMRSFVSTLQTRPSTQYYYTDNDLVRYSVLEGSTRPVLLKVFREEGNNLVKDGRFLFLPRDKYKNLPTE